GVCDPYDLLLGRSEVASLRAVPRPARRRALRAGVPPERGRGYGRLPGDRVQFLHQRPGAPSASGCRLRGRARRAPWRCGRWARSRHRAPASRSLRRRGRRNHSQPHGSQLRGRGSHATNGLVPVLDPLPRWSAPLRRGRLGGWISCCIPQTVTRATVPMAEASSARSGTGRRSVPSSAPRAVPACGSWSSVAPFATWRSAPLRPATSMSSSSTRIGWTARRCGPRGSPPSRGARRPGATATGAARSSSRSRRRARDLADVQWALEAYPDRVATSLSVAAIRGRLRRLYRIWGRRLRDVVALLRAGPRARDVR